MLLKTNKLKQYMVHNTNNCIEFLTFVIYYVV